MKNVVYGLLLGLLAGLPCVLPAQDLSVGTDDLLIEEGTEGGYDLWIRRKEGMESVLLTESTEREDHKAATYALRSPSYHPANGDEKRMLDGKFLTTEGFYSLIDSTPEEHPVLGEAFRIFLPYVVVYGNPWGRSGELSVMDGTYLSVRTFGKPYGDYSGGFRDNPFVVRARQQESTGPESARHMDQTVEAYREIAERTRGKARTSSGEADVLDRIDDILAELDTDSLDLVVALDTTESMRNDLPFLQANLMDIARKRTEGFRSFRVGIVYYRDYMEEYLVRSVPFRTDLSAVQSALDSIRVLGGRDIPEAVYEALHAAVSGYPWMAEKRLVILIGDAPPHPRPRGSITREQVYREAEELGVEIQTIILPY